MRPDFGQRPLQSLVDSVERDLDAALPAAGECVQASPNPRAFMAGRRLNAPRFAAADTNAISISTLP